MELVGHDDRMLAHLIAIRDGLERVAQFSHQTLPLERLEVVQTLLKECELALAEMNYIETP